MKGLAVEQIIMLAIGVIVLALIGYLIYSQFVKSGSSLTSTNCQSDIVASCTKCKTCIVGNGGSWTTCPTINDGNSATNDNIENTGGGTRCTSSCKMPLGCKRPVPISSPDSSGCWGINPLIGQVVDVPNCQAVGVS
ncbi:MAG TPA: hypothetical protein VJH34_04625 [archaeon]|nr:hypothetical protein [archaeon]